MSTESERELDLVLVGATGYVGRLTAQQLARQAPDGLRIGLAGRSADRLVQIQHALPDSAGGWPLITVDVLDGSAVADLAGRTRVVVSTVGPYLRYGLPLVQACARAGTHYADLTGETLFVRRSIDAANADAVASGARIVHSCGFDSVPSDLGVGLCAQAATEVLGDSAGGERLESAVLHVRSLRGGISGGTVDSLRQQILETEGDSSTRRLLGDPMALVDEVVDRTYGSARRRRFPVERDDESGRWQAPFVMGPYNRQIVQRSNALTHWSYGRELSYREVVDAGRGPLGAVSAAAIAVGTGGLVAGLTLPPTRWLLDKALPKPGEGPSEKERAEGRFRVVVEARTPAGRRFCTTIGADHDPGYDGTAVMLAEAGLGLATGVDLGPAGVVTPMVALGRVLPDRLRAQGFEVATKEVA